MTGRNVVFYSLAFGGSKIAPVQLARSLESLRVFDRDMPVFVFLFGEAPQGFIDELLHLQAQVRPLGNHRDYIARREPDRADLFALDPKIHRWLVLDEPELKTCNRLLYIDSDTLFFAPPSCLFDRYQDADLYAREEPFSRRSIHGHDPSFVDEEGIEELRAREVLNPVPPFNTGVCLFTRQMADAITKALPRYFDYLFRFLSWFQLHPDQNASSSSSSTQVLDDRLFGEAAKQALPYRSRNRWIVDQVALWLALGQFTRLRYDDFSPNDVWQGAEYQQMFAGRRLPILCHYFGSNTMQFFQYLQRLPPQSARP